MNEKKNTKKNEKDKGKNKKTRLKPMISKDCGMTFVS
jgi:hypothetical protein